MKVRTVRIVIAAIFSLFLFAPFSVGASGDMADSLQWGQANDGVQMALAATDSNGPGLQVMLRNVGDRDVTLNLGSMMANGKVQLPDYISINFTDAQGKTRQFKFADKNHLAVAGRLDDYVVPLRVGSMYTLTFTLDQFWCEETKEFAITLLPGKNRLTAQFEGRGAKHVNLDMPAIKLMNFWLGKVESNTLVIER